ncbi:MAG: sugar kinase, partial [Candidatus Omnitrophica bacterium]|nr:sugar kinase [Candidatus Omnitrophota bacterium]
YPVERIVDPTGAGDSFAGAFMGYLSKEKKINISTIKKSVVYGIILSSFNVEGFGLDRMSKLKYSEIKERLMEFKQKIEF